MIFEHCNHLGDIELEKKKIGKEARENLEQLNADNSNSNNDNKNHLNKKLNGHLLSPVSENNLGFQVLFC